MMVVNADDNDPYYSPRKEYTGLVVGPKIIRQRYGLFTLDVKSGRQMRLFKNGVFVGDLTPGRHRPGKFSLFPVEYSVMVLDTRIQTTPSIIARGEIPGGPGTAPCNIEVELKLTYQLKDIETLLQTVNPHTRLELITKDQVATQISQLRYNEQDQWATKLRDELQRWLQINATARTGLQVWEVLIVSAPKGVSEADRMRLKKILTRDEIDIEAMRAEADRRKKVQDAQAIAQAAGAVGLDASELALGQMEGGREILAAHLHQEEVRINALGIAGAQPLVREYTPEAGQLPAAGGTSASSAGPGGRMTPDFPSDASAPGSATQEPPPQSAPAGPSIDMDRVNMEIAQLQKTGYGVQHVRAQVNNAQGGVSLGYKVTVFPSEGANVQWERVQFELDPQFPQTAPLVMLALAGAAPKRWNDYILQNWKSFTRLDDVMDAVIRTVPA